MPRLVFEIDEVSKFVSWLATRDLEKYDFYRTRYNEIIASPTKSTQPLVYAVIVVKDVNARKELFGYIAKNKKFVFDIESFDWDSTKMPGVERTYLENQ
jgi:hypothetical protein